MVTFLSHTIVRDTPTAIVPVTLLMRIALRIWYVVLTRNRGLRYAYILNQLPAVASSIFVDASSSLGCFGVHGFAFFSVPYGVLRPFIRLFSGWESFPCVQIAWLELLSAFITLHLLAHRYPTRIGVVWCGVVWCGVVWCGVV